MEFNFTVTKLSHEDIVRLCSLMEYAPEMELTYPKELRDKYKEDGDCIEDIMAKILLDGGKIKFVDCSADLESIEDAIDPAPGVEIEDMSEDYDCRIGYNIGLDDLLRALNDSSMSHHVSDFLQENDDMWTGYSIFQVAAFGELVYG